MTGRPSFILYRLIVLDRQTVNVGSALPWPERHWMQRGIAFVRGPRLLIFEPFEFVRIHTSPISRASGIGKPTDHRPASNELAQYVGIR